MQKYPFVIGLMSTYLLITIMYWGPSHIRKVDTGPTLACVHEACARIVPCVLRLNIYSRCGP